MDDTRGWSLKRIPRGTDPEGMGQFGVDVVEDLQLLDVEVEQLARLLEAEGAILQGGFNLGPVLVGGAVDEGVGGEVSGQADAAGDDDVGLGASAPQPFTAALGKVV